MPGPMVSIVIPVYNGGNYLAEAIESALAQDYKPTELIVVNDGSSDGGETRRIATSYGRRLVYVEKENGGVATALNAGIERMKGDFFSWLSHDDLYYPDKLSKQIEFLRGVGRENVVLFSHEDQIDERGSLIHRSTGFAMGEEPLAYRLMYSHFIGGCSLLVPKTAFDATGGFSSAYKTVQDYDLWFRMIASGFEFLYCPITSGKSRQHDGQDSRSKSELCKAEKESLFISVQETLPREYWLDRFRDPAEAIFKLERQFDRQGLSRLSAYDRNLLQAELQRRSPVERCAGIVRYGFLRKLDDARRMRARAIRLAKKKTLKLFRLISRS